MVMVIVRIKGGLGNQLFQYAVGYSMARRLGVDLVIDNSFYPNQTLRGYKLNDLKIECNGVVKFELPSVIKMAKKKSVNKILRTFHVTTIPCGNNTTYLLECKPGIVEEYFNDYTGNVYIDGYYQSEDYFGEYREDIRSQIKPNYEMEPEYQSAEAEVKSCSSVVVHVRRGDFLKAQYESNPRHYLLGEQYYRNALKYIEEKVEHPIFFWFSDDIEWVKDTFGDRENFRFVSLGTKHGDIDEMLLMSKCKHIIAANSTFSWWASWLNENEECIHTCPAKQYGNERMIPSGWIKVECE